MEKLIEILMSDDIESAIRENEEFIFTIIPELRLEKNFDHKNKHHCYDVWEHTIFALKNSRKDLETRLVVLLHDIGKPYCYTEDNGVRHYKGHPIKSAELSKVILKRLGYTDVDRLYFFILNHDTITEEEMLNENNIELYKKLLTMQYCDAVAHTKSEVPEKLNKLASITEMVLKKENRIILKNILLSDDIESAIRENEEFIFSIIPELKAEKGFDQKSKYHCYDVWDHTICALKNSSKDLDLRLALLFHDIGKPYCYTEDNGVRHFKGHAIKSGELAPIILDRLGYKDIDDIIFLISNHATTIKEENVNEDNIFLYKKLLCMQYCDASAYAPEVKSEIIERLNNIRLEINKKKVKR